MLDDSLFLRRYEVPFVGREESFSTLRGMWREVRRGQSRAAIVSGEAGIGKSRMAGELLRLAALDGGYVVRYMTSAGDSFTPLSTLIAVGTQLLTLRGALGCDQEYLTYLRRLGTAETVSAFSVAGMAADILYAQLVQAFAEVMSAIAEEAPLIVFIDDAERLHPTTWRVPRRRLGSRGAARGADPAGGATATGVVRVVRRAFVRAPDRARCRCRRSAMTRRATSWRVAASGTT